MAAQIAPASGSEQPEGDAQAALDFLRLLCPEGPWVLVAITPEEPLKAATFTAADSEALLAWLERNRERNLYYHPNPVRDAVASPRKARKVDVAEVRFLHVDCDPRAREDLAAERERIAAALGAASPTFLIDSGGGYQALWRLSEPITLDGTEAAADDAALHNLTLAQRYEGDIPARDVSRVLRLPGTTNWPNAKKRAAGRGPAPARLAAAGGCAFPLSSFPKAIPPGGTSHRPSQSTPIAISACEAQHLASVDDLPASLSALAKAVIEHGGDPNDVARWPSRSEALFFVCCELVRAGVADEVILGVVTNPEFRISDSVIDKGATAPKYAMRQIARARESVAADSGDPIAWVNQRYFAALEGAKVAFYREEPDGTVEAMQSSAFDFELAPKVAEFPDEMRRVPYSKLWKSSSRRRYYSRGFLLDSSESHDPLAYNLWKGFGIEPRSGSWSLMREHIEKVLAAGDATHADYITRWTAWTLQNPATPPRVALVFKGDEGVGKGIFANALVRIFGVHGMRVQNMLHVAGRFNAHLRHCCLLFADEALVPGSDLEGALKGMVTEPTIPIERKGVDVVQAENHLHIIMASNNEWVVPAGIGARRFAVFAASGYRKGDVDYFARLAHEMNGGGLAAMLHDLLALDLGRWHPEAARPETRELARQKTQSLAPIERVWFDCLVTGLLPVCAGTRDRWGFVPTRAFRDQVAIETRSSAITLNDVSAFFDAMQFEKRRERNGAGRGYEIPPLREARQRWAQCRFAIEWDATEHWMEPEPSPQGSGRHF